LTSSSVSTLASPQTPDSRWRLAVFTSSWKSTPSPEYGPLKEASTPIVISTDVSAPPFSPPLSVGVPSLPESLSVQPARPTTLPAPTYFSSFRLDARPVMSYRTNVRLLRY